MSTLKQMGSAGLARARLTRLRWRLRGAWQWPAFAACLAFDAASLRLLPVSGSGYPNLAGALLLAGFMNLIAIAILAPLAGRALRRRRPDLPRVVAENYAGTALLAALAAGVLSLGLLHRPVLDAQRRALAAQALAVHRFVLSQAPVAYRENLAWADTRRVDDKLYRTCVPGPGSRRALCLWVDTSQSPPGLRLDPNPEPNGRYFASTPEGG